MKDYINIDTSHKQDNKINMSMGKILLIIIVLYAIFQVGRSFESNQASKLILNTIDKTVYTDRTVDNGTLVNCIPNKDIHTLLNYTGVDY